MKSTTALILIDLQNDFCPGGALPVPEGDQVIPVANALLDQFDLVVATQDWHPEGHLSFAGNHDGAEVGETIDLQGHPQILWPGHCVQGSWGADFVAELRTERIQHVFRKGTDPTVDSYSGFFDNRRQRSTGLHEFLSERGVNDLVLMGLATDYCVKFSVLDACELGYRVRVLRGGCRGVELRSGDSALALQEMENAGAAIIAGKAAP